MGGGYGLDSAGAHQADDSWWCVVGTLVLEPFCPARVAPLCQQVAAVSGWKRGAGWHE